MRRSFHLLVTMIAGWIVFSGTVGAAEPPSMESLLLKRSLLANVSFALGSAELDAASRERLDRAVEGLQVTQADRHFLRVEGHASPDGDVEFNVLLSMRRAVAVQAYLTSTHALPVEIYLTGFGGFVESDPAASRRVDLFLYEDAIGMLAAPMDHLLTRTDDLEVRP